LGEESPYRLPGLRRASTYPQMTRVLGDGGAGPGKGVLSGYVETIRGFAGS
jgi:hypothetical protein